MRPYLVIGALLAAVLATPALAEDLCAKPEAPRIDAKVASANLDSLTAAKQQTEAFIAASDTYQSCLLEAAKAKLEEAKASKKPFDPSIAKRAQSLVRANQSDKEKVGKAFNEAVRAYKQVNPT